MSAWRNRIVGYGEINPAEITANPKNFRTHPKSQREALEGVMAEIGVVQNVIVNKRTGLLVDGHLRVVTALAARQPAIPVTYVDLSEAEEAAVLATLDPLSALAGTDYDKLDSLLGEVNFESSAVNAMLAGLSDPSLLDEPIEPLPDPDASAAQPGDEDSWPTISVRVPPTTLTLYRSIQDMLDGDNESAKFVDLINRASETLHV